MRDPISPFSINCHSSIRWGGAVTVWFDPFRVEKTTGDGDVIFITHDHYDHFSPEDIRRVMKPDAVLVLPESCRAAALAAGFSASQLLPVRAVSCDAAFPPVGGTYTMTAAEAAALANALHPQIAVPTHYGSIVGTMTDGDDFAAQLAPGIRCVKLI